MARFSPPPVLVAKYIRILSQYKSELDAARAAGHQDQVQEIVHKIKGSAGLYGFSRLSELAGKVLEAASVVTDMTPGLDLFLAEVDSVLQHSMSVEWKPEKKLQSR